MEGNPSFDDLGLEDQKTSVTGLISHGSFPQQLASVRLAGFSSPTS